MNSGLPDLIASVATDFGTLLGVAVSATATNAIQVLLSSYLQRRAEASRSILLEELSLGNRLSSDVDKDEFCGLFFSYLTATRHGAARLNLRLMAQMIAGTLQPGFALRADELAHYSGILSQLTRDEIQLVATMWRLQESFEDRKDVSDQEKLVAIHNEAIESLVPSVFPTKDEYTSVATSATRFGLILVRSVWGGSRFDLAPVVAKLIRLSSFESAIAKESV